MRLKDNYGGFSGRSQWREPAHPSQHRGRQGASADDTPRSLKRCYRHAPSSRRLAHGTASDVRSASGGVSARWEGRCPFGAGLSCFAPSPGVAESRPFRASIPIAGAPPASRRFVGRPVARSPQGCRERDQSPTPATECGHAFLEVPDAGDADPSRHASAAVLQEERCHSAMPRPAGASHRPFPTSSAFARGGGSLSQMSSPGNTMPRPGCCRRAPRGTGWPRPSARRADGGDRAGPRGCGRWLGRDPTLRRTPRSRPGRSRTPRPRCCAAKRRRR